MSNTAYLLVAFFGLPFAIGAAFHFAPTWVAVPAAAVLAIYWIGVCISIGEARK